MRQALHGFGALKDWVGEAYLIGMRMCSAGCFERLYPRLVKSSFAESSVAFTQTINSYLLFALVLGSFRSATSNISDMDIWSQNVG